MNKETTPCYYRSRPFMLSAGLTLTEALAAGMARVAAHLSDEAFLYLDAPQRRVSVPDCPIPYNPELMSAVIPDRSRIASAMKTLLRF